MNIFINKTKLVNSKTILIIVGYILYIGRRQKIDLINDIKVQIIIL